MARKRLFVTSVMERALCKHKERKYDCADCNKRKEKRKRRKIDWTKHNCVHGKNKYRCVLCDGSGLRKTQKCPIKIFRDMMDTVGFALPICFRINLLYVIIGRRRTLLQLFLKKNFLILPGSATRALKMGVPGEGLTVSWIREVTS